MQSLPKLYNMSMQSWLVRNECMGRNVFYEQSTHQYTPLYDYGQNKEVLSECTLSYEMEIEM